MVDLYGLAAGAPAQLSLFDGERRWIGVDNSALSIATTLRCFASGLQPMGDFVSQKPDEPADQLDMNFLSEVSSQPGEARCMPDDFALYADKKTSFPKISGQADLSKVADLLYASLEEEGIKDAGLPNSVAEKTILLQGS